jgi:hypothetical protein
MNVLCRSDPVLFILLMTLAMFSQLRKRDRYRRRGRGELQAVPAVPPSGQSHCFHRGLLLAENKIMSTGEIAKAIGRSVPRTSNILGGLRLAELVRYETEGRHARYRLKHPRELRRILDSLSGFIKTTSVSRR